MARRPDNPRPGLLVIDKPQGLTSHDVVSRVRRLAHTRKVGHGGTLDPMATGVLVIGIGKATKLLTWVSGHSKEYRATIRFGVATNTDDAEGVATAAVGCDSLSEDQLESALAPLRGDIMQVPSTVSAIKVNGKRAYVCARPRGAGRRAGGAPGAYFAPGGPRAPAPRRVCARGERR